ncbi:hypothetical protein [Agrococcus baldri]|uniref:Lipoprotein n=1 Tax=Agrococcus baldri TaxID=153730 RepID=A0AA87UR41_9MICO|nr:hypothetical protein [Agrococcus baldri]GEK79651.1 hypothetical protein ABA31_10020 [Agrococcus baldri]
MAPMRSPPLAALALAALLALGLSSCLAPPPQPEAGDGPAPAATAPAATGAAPTAAAPDPTAAPDASAAQHDPGYCGDAFVLSQLELSGWTWAGDDEARLEAARPVAAFHPEEVVEGREVVCSTTFLMPVDGQAGAASYSVAIIAGQGGDAALALEELAAWAEANAYLPRGEGDYIEHVRMGHDSLIAAKLMFRVVGDAISATDALALEHTDAHPEDVIVTHVDFGVS